MTRAIFFFISATLLLFPILSIIEQPSPAIQLLLCLPFIIFLGIPHGAIDNILFQRNKAISNKKFIFIYLLIIIANIVFWLFFPILAYISFLLISAFHFGQAQFSHYLKGQNFILKTLYLSWGIALLSGLIYLNHSEIKSIELDYESFARFASINSEEIMFLLFTSTSFLSLSILIFLRFKGLLKNENLLMECVIFGLVMLCFYLMPLLVGFTLYFVILHSYKVLEEEYRFLNSEKIVSNIKGFLLLLTPFSLFSMFGIILLFGLIHFDLLSISYGYSMLIIISSITLPHVFVMNNFYRLLFKRNFFNN
ncbi:MAG: Brp/Blh family beta-carotene 15,15'-dioxygenase [Nitrososphaeraceae archaeon]|nr:Brp/Blh family beta-carotene 15,15'-dioxygenase [Nitrososphaeraceae archaeon]